MNNETNYSIEIIRYTINTEQQNVFVTSYAKAAKILEASPYCIGYEIIHGVDEPQRYVVRIHWTSVDDHLKRFRNSEEFKSFFNLVRPFFNNIEEMKHYESTAIVWNRN